MREKFAEVLRLQLEHSSKNTPAMARRGQLIRNDIPDELRTWPATEASAIFPWRGRLEVQGKDGTGLKTFVPWVRIYSPELSPSAQAGWYVVFLFRADGDGVCLCISHGSTRWDGADFKPRGAAEAARLMNWAHAEIGSSAAATGLVRGVDLGSNERLSRAYEATTAFSKTYATDALPNDDVLNTDLLAAVGLLGELYRALELGRSPYSIPPEVVAAAQAAEEVSRPNGGGRKAGQGRGLNAAERAAVETHAMTTAHNWLLGNGYTGVRDVHRAQSCDFLAVSPQGRDVHVEVKGTTSSFGSILMTANEVELHQRQHPDNVLVVVHDIDLHPLRTQASGGTVTALEAWDVSASRMKPLSYQCFLV